MKKKNLVNYLLACAACMPVVAMATNKAIVRADSQLALSIGAVHQNYGEKNGDYFGPGTAQPGATYLDIERGDLKRIGLDYSFLYRHVYAALNANYTRGNDTYIGHLLQNGQPVQGTTNNKMTDVSFRLGPTFDTSQNTVLIPFVEIGAHKWTRTLNQFQTETYDNEYYGAGLLGQYAINPKWVIGTSAMVGETRHATISGGGLPDNAPLGSSNLYKLGVATSYNMVGNWYLNARADYLHFGYGHSAVYAVPGGFVVIEPDSTTRQLSFMVGMGYSF